jgi:hypothetical protein
MASAGSVALVLILLPFVTTGTDCSALLAAFIACTGQGRIKVYARPVIIACSPALEWNARFSIKSTAHVSNYPIGSARPFKAETTATGHTGPADALWRATFRARFGLRARQLGNWKKNFWNAQSITNSDRTGRFESCRNRHDSSFPE